jgi:hypothetical protein
MKYMNLKNVIAVVALCISLITVAKERELNNGNLVLQNIPEIPNSIKQDLQQYSNVRSASLYGWAKNEFVKNLLVQLKLDRVAICSHLQWMLVVMSHHKSSYTI